MIVLTKIPILLSNILYLIAELKDDGLLFICLAVAEVSGSCDPQVMVLPLFELHATDLRIELKHFGYIYLVIHICNFMGIVTVYNRKPTCVLVRQIFFSFTLFSLVSFYSEQLLVKRVFFYMGVF